MLNPLRSLAQARKAVADRRALPEAAGLVLLGVGLFMVLSLVSYNPADTPPPGVEPQPYQSLAGPLGARLAHAMLSRIGLRSKLSAPWSRCPPNPF